MNLSRRTWAIETVSFTGFDSFGLLFPFGFLNETFSQHLVTGFETGLLLGEGAGGVVEDLGEGLFFDKPVALNVFLKIGFGSNERSFFDYQIGDGGRINECNLLLLFFERGVEIGENAFPAFDFFNGGGWIQDGDDAAFFDGCPCRGGVEDGGAAGGVANFSGFGESGRGGKR